MTESDSITLRLLAEYRILTSSQIAFLELRSRQVVRRRLSVLVEEGCIETHVLSLGRRRGRPEQFVSLTPVGWSRLREQGMVRPPCEEMASGAGPHACPRHHLLLNWFRLHLVQIERVSAPRRLTDEQALACGFDWLEKHYVSRETRGYAAAVLDAMEEPWDGIFLVCRALADVMKQEIRRQMVAGELVRLLAPFGWSDRVHLVRECLTRLELVLPEQLRTLPPAQLVDELPGLILLVFSANQPLLPRALA